MNYISDKNRKHITSIQTFYQEMNLWFLVKLFFFSHVLFLLLSAIFFKERLSYEISSEFIIGLVNNGGNFPYFQHNRFATAFSQILPILGLKLNLSFPAVTFLYSLNIELLYFITFVVLLCSKQISLLIPFSLLTLTLRGYTYFMSTAEYGHELCFMFLFFSILSDTEKNNFIRILLLILTGVLFAGAHPLIIIPFTLIGVYHFNVMNTTQKLFLLIPLLFFFSLNILFSSPYYAVKTEIVLSFLKIPFYAFTSMPGIIRELGTENFKYILHHTILAFSVVLFLFLLSVYLISVLKFKLRKKLFLTIFSLLLTLIPILLLGYLFTFFQFQIELYSYNLAIFLGLIVAYVIKSKYDMAKVLNVFLAIIVIFSIFKLFYIKTYISDKSGKVVTVLEKMKSESVTKGVLPIKLNDPLFKDLFPVNYLHSESIVIQKLYMHNENDMTFTGTLKSNVQDPSYLDLDDVLLQEKYGEDFDHLQAKKIDEFNSKYFNFKKSAYYYVHVE